MEENKVRMKELVDTIADLKTQIQTMEVRMKQEEHMKRRVMEDCSELVKNNTNLKCELEDVQRRLKKEYDQREQKLKQRQDKIKDAESAKEELGRIRDELSMAKISAESKDRRIHDLSQQVFIYRGLGVESSVNPFLFPSIHRHILPTLKEQIPGSCTDQR